MNRSPLDAVHRELGAKMVPFGGWEMPLAYPAGTLAEHRACREECAMFDVSHLGTVRLEGPDAFGRIQNTLTADLSKIGPGRTQYTHLLGEDGAVLDDIIVWWLGEGRFDVMPNASNTAGVRAALGGRDVTADRAIVAIQGPNSRRVVASVSSEAAAVARRGVVETDIGGAPCIVAGTGYTGEDGVEIAVPREHAEALWRALMAAGATPAGLGARDTLRLEAGLPLHGHELGPGISPLHAGLGWVVAWHKENFAGRDALARIREAGPDRTLHGIRIEGRRPAREGSTVSSALGDRLGVVTSGNFAPTLQCCVALALLSGSHSPGEPVSLDVRGTALHGEIVALPFYAARTNNA